ncbi:MAG: hypothetical protein JSS12_08735, partial [Verrucomicrobia bacterium]|nr:hypothetical protein [Verrucomicrobiota bacterium]
MIINALDQHIYALVTQEPKSVKNELESRVKAVAAAVLATIEVAIRIV